MTVNPKNHSIRSASRSFCQRGIAAPCLRPADESGYADPSICKVELLAFAGEDRVGIADNRSGVKHDCRREWHAVGGDRSDTAKDFATRKR